jgi:hypothetical protein
VKRRRKVKEIIWPHWPVDNAIACLEESRDRINNNHDSDKEEYVKGVNLALNLAISTIRSMNEITPPQPPSIRIIFRNATGELIEDIGRAVETFGRTIQDANKWGWKHDPYD